MGDIVLKPIFLAFTIVRNGLFIGFLVGLATVVPFIHFTGI